jgi:uncharacterized protein (DUF1697 family)
LVAYQSARLGRNGECEEQLTTNLALLRAINVGGHGTIWMDELCGVAETLGLSEMRTSLQAGNL